jgi:2-polyprenyl-6-methoxyphenol hydroxylase-like FAD-dependent oxidoreductase
VSSKSRLSVLVSGASVSGLTVAYWLHRHGIAVDVVEQAPHLRPGGQALDVRGPALEVAARMGIVETLRQRATRLTGVSAVDASGAEIYRDTERTLTGGRFDSPDIEVLRDDLCRVLLGTVEAHVPMLFGDRIVAMRQDAAGVDVQFARAPPRHYDVVVGADGLHSGVRRIAFGPEADFLRRLGNSYVATFGMPNFLGLERWEVLYQDEARGLGAMVMGLERDAATRAYVGFKSDVPVAYDFRDIAGQKRLVAERVRDGGWVLPTIVDHMVAATDFHFDAISQIRMDTWSQGRIVLVGDAGYSVALATGQGTTVAMVCAYVLAGELAAHLHDPVQGIAVYEELIRDYVIRNQDDAVRIEQEPQDADDVHAGQDAASRHYPDFGALVHPFALKDYAPLQ